MDCHSPERKYMQPMRGGFQIKQVCFKTGLVWAFEKVPGEI
jgi:hypothetical protein